MTYRILFTPEPPEYTAELDERALARLDVRFAHIAELERREILPLVLGDTAALQCANVTLRAAHRELHAVPGTHTRTRGADVTDGTVGLTEHQLQSALALDLACTDERLIEPHVFTADVATWPNGTLYVLSCATRDATPAVRRRLNLAAFADRLEFEFLIADDLPGVDVLRAHRLLADGRYAVWRSELKHVSSSLRAPEHAGTRAKVTG